MCDNGNLARLLTRCILSHKLHSCRGSNRRSCQCKGFTIWQPVEHSEAFQNSDVLERSVEFIIPGMSEEDL